MNRSSALLTLVLLAAAAAPGHAAEVRGTVFDRADKPLTQAEVMLALPSGEVKTTTTGAQGRYRFADLPTGRYAVVARKAGFARQRQAVSVTGAAQVTGVSFRLAPWQNMPWSLIGTIFREDGKRPLLGATVSLYRDAMPGQQEPAGSATSDETGFYAFTDLKPGRYTLQVSAPGYLPAPARPFSVRDGADRQTRDVSLIQPPPETVPGAIAGEVLMPDGQPMANKEVQVWLEGYGPATDIPWGTGWQRRTWNDESVDEAGRLHLDIGGAIQTDAAGHFQIIWPAGTWALKAWAKGFLSQTQTVTLPPGKTVTVAIRLAAGEDPLEKAPLPPPPPQPRRPGKIRGVVLRPDGTPLANTGVYVFAVPHSEAYGPWGNDYADLAEGYVVTDAAGRFERMFFSGAGPAVLAVKSRGFAESEAVTVQATSAGGPEMTAEAPAAGGPEATLRLQGPAAAASGTVTDGDGKPVAGARVFAYHVLGRYEDQRFEDAPRNVRGGRNNDGGPWPFDTPPENLKPGAIAGLLRHGLSYTETDAQGRFTLAELDAGAYHFLATAPGMAEDTRRDVTLKAGAAAPALALRLAALGGIEGKLLRPDGTLLPTTQVSIERMALREMRGTASRVPCGADGHYRLEDLAPGDYRLTARVPGYMRATLDKVTVQPGMITAGVDFRLDEGASLRGRVLKPDGTPAPGASVRFQGGSEQATRISGEDGSFALMGLAPGAGAAVARLAGFAPVQVAVTLPQAPDAALELKLAPAATLHGTVRGAEGNPLAGASVSWSLEGGAGSEYDRSMHTQTDAAGGYRLTGIAAGKIALNVGHREHRSARETRDVAAGADVPLDITLERLRYGKLRGRLLRADATPAVGVTVHAYVQDANQTTAVTDPQGRFLFDRVASGKGNLMLAGRGLQRSVQEFEVRPDEETALPDVTVPAMGTLEVDVQGREHVPPGCQVMVLPVAVASDAAGKPLTPAQATRLYLAGTPETRSGTPGMVAAPSGVTDAFLFSQAGVALNVYPAGSRLPFRLFEQNGGPNDGAGGVHKLEGVPVGVCRPLVAAMRDQDMALAFTPGDPVTVVADQVARVAVTLAPGGTLAVRTNGMPADRNYPQLWFYRRDTLELAGLAAGVGGTFSVAGCPPGEYLACAWVPGKAAVRQPFSIRAGEKTDLTLNLVPGVALRGRVEGQRPKELCICAESEGSFSGVKVAADGTFTLEHLLPGTYTLRAWATGEAKIVSLANVRVGDAGAEGVNIEWK